MSIIKEIPFKHFDLDEGEERIMQLGLGFTLFFPRPFRDVRNAICDLWHAYLKVVDPETFTWARLGGGNRSRKVNASTFRTIEDWFTGAKDCGDTCWVSVHDGPMDQINQHSFALTGFGDAEDSEFDTEASYVEIYFPLQYLDSPGAPDIADFLIKLAEPIPYYCGVAGCYFHRSPYKYYKTIGLMRSLSQRFQGVEVSANQRLCYQASIGITTVNWLTFVGTSYVNKLGGIERIQPAMPPESTVRVQSNGIAIQTGENPLLGYSNTGLDELKAIRQVYRVLAPAQSADPDFEFSSDDFDGDATVEWLQRLR